MTSETNIPLGQFKATCPKCGAELGVERSGVEISGDDNLVCPVHGAVMKVQELRDSIRSEVGNQVAEQLRNALKGFTRR